MNLKEENAQRDQQLVNEDITAKLLDCRTQTLRNWRSQPGGRGPRYFKIGRNVRYSLADIRAFLDECRVSN